MAQSQTILIIDDDPYALKFAAAMLQTQGFNVLTANSVDSAQAALKKSVGNDASGLDAILCDWKMPDVDGIMAFFLFSEGVYKDVPFILLTRAVTKEDLDEASHCEGIAGVILKSANPKELAVKINQAIMRKKKTAGRLETSMELPSGPTEFRIYVSADGQETQTVSLDANLNGGQTHVLRLIIAENGSASAQLN